MAIWGVECGLVKTTPNGKMISKVLAKNGKESKLYNSILEHITDMKSSDLNQLKDAFRDWEGDVIGDADNSKHLALALYSLIHSDKFKDWFIGSKVLDENNEPLLLFHGTNAKFDTFSDGDFSYLSTDRNIAKGYGDIVMPVFLNIQKPYYEDGGNLSNQGYPELFSKMVDNNSDGFISLDKRIYVSSEPEQIKSLFDTASDPESNLSTSQNKDDYEKLQQGVQLNYDDYSHIENLDERRRVIESRADYLESKGEDVQITDKGVKHWIDGTNISFEGEDIEGSKMLNITEEKWKDWFEAKGIDYKPIVDDLIDIEGNYLSEKDTVNLINKVVRVVAGKENLDIGEAGMRVITRLIKEQNPKLFREMMNKVDSYELYADIFMKYRELKQYQTSEGKPDVAKIKEEVIAKLLNEYNVDKQEDSTEKPQRIETIYNWWQKAKDYLSNLFKGNPFHARVEERRGEAEKLLKDAVENFDKGTYEMDVNRLTDISEGETHREFTDRTIKTVKDIAVKVPDRTAIVTHGTAIALLKEWKRQGYKNENVTESGQDTHIIDNGHIETLKIDGKTLFFVRHGESKSNAMDLPSNTQTPLTEKGKQDAIETASNLKALNISGIIATDTQRTSHTADIIRNELGLPGSSRLAGQIRTLFGIDTKNKETTAFHIETLNKISSFLEAAGIPEEFVDVIRDGNGTPVENALAAANFMTGTVQYIKDIEKRDRAWDKKPEEAAHFFFRLMRNDNPLKDALWKAANDFFLGENYEGVYKDTLANKEEFIGQKIADAIKALENGYIPTTPIEKNFLDKFMDFISNIVNHIKSWFGKEDTLVTEEGKIEKDETEYDPFGVAAIKILEGNASDMMTWDEYKMIHDRTYPDSILTTESIDNKDINRSVDDINEQFEDLINNKFKKRTRFLKKTLDKLYTISLDEDKLEKLNEKELRYNLQDYIGVKPFVIKHSSKELNELKSKYNYQNITPALKGIPKILEKYRKNSISLTDKIVLDGVKKDELDVYNSILQLIKDENPKMKSISGKDFAEEVSNYLKMNYMLGFAEELNYLNYRIAETFSTLSDSNRMNAVRHRKISLKFNDSYMEKKSNHFGPHHPVAFGTLTPFYSKETDAKDAVLMHEIQSDYIESMWQSLGSKSVDIDESFDNYLSMMEHVYEMRKWTNLNTKSFNDAFRRIYHGFKDDNVTQVFASYNDILEIKERLNEGREFDKSYPTPGEVEKNIDKLYSVKRRWEEIIKKGGIESTLSNDLKTRLNQYIETAKNMDPNLRRSNMDEIVGNFKNDFGFEIAESLSKFLGVQFGEDDVTKRMSEILSEASIKLPLNRKRTDVNLSLKSTFKVIEKDINKRIFNLIVANKNTLGLARGIKNRIALIDKILSFPDSKIKKIKENVDYNINFLEQEIQRRAREQYDLEVASFNNNQKTRIEDIKEMQKRYIDLSTQIFKEEKASIEKQVQENEKNVKKNIKYFIPLVDHLVRTHLSDYGIDKPLYFSGYEITKSTQGSEATAKIYAGPEEVAAGMVDKIGPLYKAISDYAKENGIAIKYDEVPGIKREVSEFGFYYNGLYHTKDYDANAGDFVYKINYKEVPESQYFDALNRAQTEPVKGYQLDLSNYTGLQRDAPILFGMDNKVKEPSAGQVLHDKMKAEEKNLRLERDTENKDKSWYMRNDPLSNKENRVAKRPHDYVEEVYRDAYGTRSEEAMDSVYAETGTRLHKYMDDILLRMIDPVTGIRRDKMLDQKTNILPGEEKIYAKLEKYLLASMNKFPKMTGDQYRFVHEQMIYKPAKKKGDDMAGTLDFLAVAPDGSVYHRDWKFMKEKSENVMTRDIDNVKQKAHRVQLNWYANMLRTAYGVKEIRESNTIPFKLIFGKGKNENTLLDVSIGDPDYVNINDASMLPVTSGDIDFEGDPRMSALTKNLMKVLDKMYNENVPYEDKLVHQQEIQELSYAIRTLVNKKNVEGLITTAANRVKSYIKDIKEVQDIMDKQVTDGKFDKETIGNLVAKISDAKISLETFKDMRNNLSEYIKDMDLDEKDKINKQLDKINVNITEAINMMYDKNTGLGILEKAGIKIGEDIGIFNIMSPDRELTWDQQMFNTHTSIPIKTGAAYSKIRSTAESRISMRTAELAHELSTIQKSLSEWMGGTWDDMKLIDAICKKDENGNWTPYLVNKISKDFYENLKTAMETGSSTWILKNIDKVAYKKLYDEQLERVKKRAEEKIFDSSSYKEDPTKRKGTIDQEKREKYVQWFIDTYDINRPTAFTFRNNWLRNFATDANWSEEYKNIYANESLRKLYEFTVNLNKRAHRSGMLGDYYIHFLPQMRKRTMDAALHFEGADMKRSLISNFVVEEGDKRYRDEFTGEPINKLRGKYIYDLKDDKKGYSGVDTDLMRALTLYTKEVIAHEEKSNEEGVVKALLAMEKNKRVLATHQNQVIERQGKPVTKESTTNYEWLEKEIIATFYDDKYQGEDPGITVMVDGKEMHLSAKKSVDAFVQAFSLKSLGLNPMTAFSNLFGGSVNAYINSGKHFTSTDLTEAYRRVLEAKLGTEEGSKIVSLLNHFTPLTEDLSIHLGKEISSKKNVLNFLSSEGLMVLLRKSDNIVQMANAIVYFENTMVENGKLVNIREYVKRKNNYYEMFESKNANKYSQTDRDEKRKLIEKEINELKESRNLLNDKNIKYSDDNFNIDWSVKKLDESEIQLRQQIQQLTRDCVGNRTPDELAHINTFMIGTAVMNFRSWIPRLAQKRYGRFKFNAGYGTYEQGKMLTVMDAINDHAQSKLKNIGDLLGFANLGSKESNFIAIAQRQYQKRVAEARFQEQSTESMFEKTVTEGEFVESFLRDIRAQVRELQATAALMAGFFAALAWAKSLNEDDEDYAQKGAIKWSMRMMDKFTDELGFFYSPMSAKNILGSGTILPSFSVFTDLSQFLIHLGKEAYYIHTGDEDAEEKNHILKYPISYIPAVNQISAYSAMIWEDYAKSIGRPTMGYNWGGFQR